MFTALMSLALVGVVALAGVMFSRKMDELARHAATSTSESQGL